MKSGKRSDLNTELAREIRIGVERSLAARRASQPTEISAQEQRGVSGRGGLTGVIPFLGLILEDILS